MDALPPLILIKNSDGRRIQESLDPSLKLKDVRTILILKKFMTEDDNFIYNNEVLARTEEANRNYADILSDNVLSIGVPTVTDSSGELSGPARFQGMNFNEKRDLLGERNVNVFTGLTFKEVNSNVTFTQTFKKLYKFAADYVPTSIYAGKEVDSEEIISYSQDVNSVMCSGVNSTSVTLSTPWVQGQAGFTDAQERSKSSDKVKSYHTQRYLRNMVKLQADINKLIIEDEFADALKNAVYGLGVSKKACLNLVAVLNEYGWYIPIEYTLGGAVYSTKVKEVSSYQEAVTESQSFKASFNVSFGNVGAGGGHDEEKSKLSKNANTRSHENVILHQIGGACPTYENDFTCWSSSLNQANNWRIIRYDMLLPSLMLLRGTDDDTLSTCLQTLRTYCHYRDVKSLQMYINIQKYELQIASKIEIPYY